MAPKRLTHLAVSFLVLAMFSYSASAIPIGGNLEAAYTETFSIADGSAIVHSEVYRYDSGQFVYTYLISNSSSAGLSLFSAAILPDADAFNPTYDTASGVVPPSFWATVGTPVQSVDYLFADTIDNDGLTSALLWYNSNNYPAMGQAMLCGTLEGTPCVSIGNALTPSTVPEPATISLFVVGSALMVMIRRRRL